jgi:hypothetical protein
MRPWVVLEPVQVLQIARRAERCAPEAPWENQATQLAKMPAALQPRSRR